MGMLEQFQKLDELILENTQPPISIVLRNQLALTREQIEAYQQSSDQQDRTLAAQLETIEKLQQQVKDFQDQKRQLEDELQRRKSQDAVGFDGHSILPDAKC